MSSLFRRRRVAPAVLIAVLALTGTASAAVVGLPSDGTQANGTQPSFNASIVKSVDGGLTWRNPWGMVSRDGAAPPFNNGRIGPGRVRRGQLQKDRSHRGGEASQHGRG